MMNKNYLKRMGAFALMGFMAFSLMGCSSKGKSEDTNGNNSEQPLNTKKTKVVVWSKNSHDLEYMTCLLYTSDAADEEFAV